MEGLYPKKIGLAQGTVDALSQTAGGETGASALASCVLPPMAMDGVYYASGLLAAMSLRASESGAAELRVDLYDLATGLKLASPQWMVEMGSQPAPPAVRCGLAPLQRGRAGFLFWYPSGAAPDQTAFTVFLSQYVTDLSGARRLVADSQTLPLGGTVCDGSPLSKTGEPYFLVGLGRVAEGPQILCKRLAVNGEGWPADPAEPRALFSIEEAWSQKVTAPFWESRPDTCLAIQNVPSGPTLEPATAALVGNWIDGTIHLAVSDPRLCILDPDGVPLWSHEWGYGRASGMVVNQFGDIFATGTADMVSGGPFLLCRYGVNHFGETQARVEHGRDGLGSYSSDPEGTHVAQPCWNGAVLSVMDHGPDQTRVFVYDRHLNFLRSFPISSASAADGGPRWRGSAKSTTWWGEAY